MQKIIVKKFKDLTAMELYQVLQLRELVFIIEQKCIYQDIDGVDEVSDHILLYEDQSLEAYARITPPGTRYKEDFAIGRVVSKPETRRKGFGREVMKIAIQVLYQQYGNRPIRISAQSYLRKFYEGFGFSIVSKEYLEDDIPHFEMLKLV